MALVVALDRGSVGVEDEGAVVVAGDPPALVQADADAPHHQRRPRLPGQLREPLAQLRVRLQAPRHRRLRPHHQDRARRGRLPGHALVARQRLLPPCRAPLHPLVHVSLHHRGAHLAFLHRIRRQPEPGPVKRDHRGQCQQRRPLGRSRRAPAPPQRVERRRAQHADEGEAVDPGDRRQSHQGRVRVLRVTETGPGEAGEDPGTPVLQGRPERGRGPGRREPPPLQDRVQPGKGPAAEPQVGGQRQRRHHAHRRVGVSVGHGHHVDPVEHRRATQPADPEAQAGGPPRGEALHRHQQEQRVQPDQDEAQVDHAPGDGLGEGPEEGGDRQGAEDAAPCRTRSRGTRSRGTRSRGTRSRGTQPFSVRHSRRSWARMRRASSGSSWS